MVIHIKVKADRYSNFNIRKGLILLFSISETIPIVTLELTQGINSSLCHCGNQQNLTTFSSN